MVNLIIPKKIGLFYFYPTTILHRVISYGGRIAKTKPLRVSNESEDKPFIITPVGGLVKEGGIKATVNVSLNPESEEHSGTEVVVFQLMNGDTPVSIIALEKDIKETEQMTAFFNVDPEAGDYTVEVYVFDRFDNRSDIAPVILADGIIIN